MYFSVDWSSYAHLDKELHEAKEFPAFPLAMSLVALAAIELYSKWDDIVALFSDSQIESKAEELKKRIKELEDNKIKISVDIEELEKAKKEIENINKVIDCGQD